MLVSQNFIAKSEINQFIRYKKNKNNFFLNSLNLNNFIKLQNSDNIKKYSNYSSKLLYFKFLEILWVLAYIPINETLSDPFFYNYRLYRTQVDILKEFYSIFNYTNYKWLLIIKPTNFFKKRNKKWISKNILLEKKFLEYILRNEKFANSYRKYYNHKEVLETQKISLIKLVKSRCFHGFSHFKKNSLTKTVSINKNKLFNGPIIFYSDIIFIPETNSSNLKIIYKLIFQFLNQRGLVIKKNRLWIINLLYGFNFLGWSLKKENGRVVIKISRENIKSHQLDLKRFLKSARFLPIDKVIINLNKKITNWQYYYFYTNYSYEICSEMNYYLFWRVWRWCKKRHKNKGTKWVYHRYWFYNEKNKWVFHANQQYLKKYKLRRIEMVSFPGSINPCEIKNWKTIQTILLTRIVNLKNVKY